METHAILVAAGKGTRFGGPKQFYLLRQRPLLFYALDSFEACREVKGITIVVPRNKLLLTRRLVKKAAYKKVIAIVRGGGRRQDSVLNGLKTIKDRDAIVAIHDGTRPVLTSNLIARGIRLGKKYRAVIFGLPINDTVKLVSKNVVVKTLSRKNLFLVQTPEFFELNLLRDAYKMADMSIEYTDESALLESLGFTVHLFTGDRFNVKVTEKPDLKVINRFLS